MSDLTDKPWEPTSGELADAVLSSDWLAGRDERIRAEERQRCALTP